MADSIVVIGRLKRKIEKLTKQRDHWKTMHDHYAKVISLQPYIERRYKSYTEAIAERERAKSLEKRCKEQELLIRLLSNDKIMSHEIKQAYDAIIKEEQKKANQLEVKNNGV